MDTFHRTKTSVLPVSKCRSRPTSRCEGSAAIVKTFSFVVERDGDTGLYVGYVPGWPGAHGQGASLNELQQNLREVVEMLLEDGDPKIDSEFIGVQTIKVT
jgi:predicted RNase H-like HicB family nuclease